MDYNYKTKSEGKLYKIVDDAIKELRKKSTKKNHFANSIPAPPKSIPAYRY